MEFCHRKKLALCTTGVEISTFLFTSENNVVAAVPILILEISPMASISSGVSVSLSSPLTVSAPVPSLNRRGLVFLFGLPIPWV